MTAGADDARFSEEEAFLAAYDAEAFQRPSLAVDVVLFGVWDDAVRVLLLRRPTHPFSGTWTLPGTFVGFEEDLPEAAARVLRVKLGLRDVAVEPFQTFGAPGRDPRTRIVTVAHLALVSRDRVPPDAGRWARVEVPWKGDAAGPIRAHSEGAELPLGFDHASIVGAAVARVRWRLGASGGPVPGPLEVARTLLPEVFTLRQVQAIHEAFAGHPVNKHSFRRKILSEGRLEATGQRESAVGHRPAELYRYR